MTHAPHIPDELLSQLRAANDRFSRSRRELERWMAASEYRHQERVARAESQVHEAGREIESIEQRIREILAASSHATDATH